MALLLCNTVFSSEILIVDYESGELTSGVPGVSAEPPPAADSIIIDTSVVRSGNYSVRSKVTNDPSYWSFGDQPRAESNSMAFLPSRYSGGDQIRYNFSFYLDPSWEVEPQSSTAIDIIWQFKRFNGGPDMFIATKRDDLVLRAPDGVQIPIIDGYPVGQWVDLQVDVKWSPDATGNVDLFYKLASDTAFTQAPSYAGRNMRNALDDNAYLKWGLYRPTFASSAVSNDTRIIYHDDITATSAAVPEPPAIVLLGTGIALLTAKRRRRNHPTRPGRKWWLPKLDDRQPRNPAP